MWFHIDLWFVSTGNNIGIEGARVLSQSLPHLPQLRQLGLGCECINVTWLCNLVVSHRFVMCVSTVNNIELDGAKALSQCLPQLTQLDLGCECVHSLRYLVMCDEIFDVQ